MLLPPPRGQRGNERERERVKKAKWREIKGGVPTGGEKAKFLRSVTVCECVCVCAFVCVSHRGTLCWQSPQYHCVSVSRAAGTCPRLSCFAHLRETRRRRRALAEENTRVKKRIIAVERGPILPAWVERVGVGREAANGGDTTGTVI